MRNKTAIKQGLARCHECGELAKIQKSRRCSLCGSFVHPRQPHSLRRTLALVISACCLYLPANIFPIMTVTQLGHAEPHTIIGGILALIHSGMTPIAILVFIASILVPLLKLIGLSILVFCVKRRWPVNSRLFTAMFRVIAFVGRWSMLDIFMISILIALVDNRGVAQVIAGSAATAFAAVVVLTMLAAKFFDPRLLWDNSNHHERTKTGQ
jgi:paraquat-inducible protein A